MKRSIKSIIGALALSFFLSSPAYSVSPDFPVTEWYSSDYGQNAQKNLLEVGIYFDSLPQPRAGQVDNGHYYGNQFWSNFGQGGYIGFQMLPGGERKLLFSWWGANGVYCSGVPNLKYCGTFSNDPGSGYAVHSNFNLQTGTEYTFKVQYGWTESATGNNWWNSYIIGNGVTTFMGSLRTPGSFGKLQGALAEWIEWLGNDRATTCDQVPFTSVWRGPARFNGVVAPTHSGHITQYQCRGTRQFDWNYGVVQEMGTK